MFVLNVVYIYDDDKDDDDKDDDDKDDDDDDNTNLSERTILIVLTPISLAI
jgi:hypothetical protein